MVDVSRRAFLGGALGLGAGVALRRPGAVFATPRPDAGTARRAIVVGAGLAGLTAAHDLRDAGWDVVVLEARDRVGGRVHTLTEPFTDGLHAESGGESIDDNHVRIQALVARYGLTTERRLANRDTSAEVVYRGRRAGASSFAAGRGGRILNDYNRYYDETDKLGEGIDPDHPERSPRAEELDRRSLADFIDGLHLVPEARFLVDAEETGEYAADPREVSLLFHAQQAAVVADVPDSAIETMRISGGNSRLPEAMAAALDDSLVTGVPVSAVERGHGAVTVHTVRGSHTGAQVVLALPPAPLRRIRFSPRLPAAAHAAVAGLDLGPATKVMTQFPERFWRADGGSGLMVTDLPFRLGWDATDSSPSTAGILTTFTTGRNGAAFAALRGDRRIAAVHRQLARVFPESRGRAGPTATMAWPDEPYTRGGYAAYRPGQVIAFWEALRHPIGGSIRFAGEHTESLAGYMESAVRSGHRVATEIGSPPPLTPVPASRAGGRGGLRARRSGRRARA
jgi:monoamine oxidase